MSTMSVNQAQIDFWNGPTGQKWAKHQTDMDRNLAEIAVASLALADARPGERVLDIGCGNGSTTLMLAEAVGPTGDVTGVDISQPMLAIARTRVQASNIRFIEADAATHPFATDRDLIFSRFGVMFFVEPVAAFANIRKAANTGGRLAFIAWRKVEENEWAMRPYLAALPFLPEQKEAGFGQDAARALPVGEGKRSRRIGIHRFLFRQERQCRQIGPHRPFILLDLAPADEGETSAWGGGFADIGESGNRFDKEHHTEAGKNQVAIRRKGMGGSIAFDETDIGRVDAALRHRQHGLGDIHAYHIAGWPHRLGQRQAGRTIAAADIQHALTGTRVRERQTRHGDIRHIAVHVGLVLGPFLAGRAVPEIDLGLVHAHGAHFLATIS